MGRTNTPIVNNLRRCSNSECPNSNPQDVSNFFKHSRSKTGLHARCKTCHTKDTSARKLKDDYGKKHYQKYKRHYNNKSFLRKYGITLDDRDRMHKAQGGKCGICYKEFPIGQLYVDHNHETKQIRDLLCTTCNTAEGFVKGDAKIAWALYQYLLKWGSDV